MDQKTDLDLARRTAAMDALAADFRNKMKKRWPEIDFDADTWPLRTLYRTKFVDVSFAATIADFEGRDVSYLLALRCLVALEALEGKRSTVIDVLYAWRLLATYLPPALPLGAIRGADLAAMEGKVVSQATKASAGAFQKHLDQLARQIDYLAERGVVDRMMWKVSAETRATLVQMKRERKAEFKTGKTAVLDRQIEAFSEATSAMLRNDERLNRMDRAVIAFTNILMCAPSRVNEPLNCKVSDRYTIEDYQKRSEAKDSDVLHSAHQLLWMKGSKGASHSAKPVLDFMIQLLERCWQIVIDGGKRSRMLVTWYEQNPNKLYLLPELEHLRGRPLCAEHTWQIMNLTTAVPTQYQLGTTRVCWQRALNTKDVRNSPELLMIDPIRSHIPDGRRAGKVYALPWDVVETYLLKQVHERMASMRAVTSHNHYMGRLSELLVLVDADTTPYLPQALDYDMIATRLKTYAKASPSVFSKLNLRMTQDGREVECYLGTHDPRRWLTTQALAARERLSDVLINKWANRLDIGQLDAYDLRTAEQKADQAAMSFPNELSDLSEGLQELEDKTAEYGLSTEIVVAHGAGISITSMDAVCQATEDRPVARTAGQVLILYPTKFGVCVHPHHEMPCRAYRNCNGCNENTAVKGHLPTNEEWRKEADKTHLIIVNQLESLITAHNRSIADDAATFEAHLLMLVQNGLSAHTMADDLIARFHEIKSQIRDPNFRNALEKAFVASGVVGILDDPEVPNGALIKYHNPKRNAAPSHEIALEAQFGSREEMDRQSALFYQQYPELAPANLGLQDQRHLLGGDDDNEGVDYADAAA